MLTPSGGGTHILINDNINDENISTNSTWSSDKINGTFAQLSLAAQDIVDNMESSLKEDYMQKIKNATPVNLLDNSDFTNPVNQRGQTEYLGSGYSIDRWACNSMACNLSIQNGYIDMKNNTNSGSTATQFIGQKIDNPTKYIGKVLTAAALVKGSIRIWIDGVHTSAPAYQNFDDWTLIVNSGVVPDNIEEMIVTIQGANKSNWQCKWAALYEGEYTVDTLPEYRPKGYGNEFMECQRYYRRYTNVGIGGNNIFLTGAVSSSATGIYCSSLNNLPMRIPSPTINFTGIAIIRTIDGYETTTGSAGYTDPIVDLYYDGSDTYLAPLRFRKQDGSAWGITNNTPVHIMIKSGILEISADL